MRKRTRGFTGLGASVEADEPVGGGDDIAEDGEAGEGGVIGEGEASALGAVGAGVELEAVLAERLKAGVGHASDGVVDAIEIDIEALGEGGLGQADAVGETGVRGRGGEQQAEAFAAERHGGESSGIVRG